MSRSLLVAFIPIFVTVDAIAAVVIYLGIGVPLDQGARRRLVTEATLTAAAVGRISAGRRRRVAVPRRLRR